MSIFIDKKTRVLVQGITGRDGSFPVSYTHLTLPTNREV